MGSTFTDFPHKPDDGEYAQDKMTRIRGYMQRKHAGSFKLNPSFVATDPKKIPFSTNFEKNEVDKAVQKALFLVSP